MKDLRDLKDLTIHEGGKDELCTTRAIALHAESKLKVRDLKDLIHDAGRLGVLVPRVVLYRRLGPEGGEGDSTVLLPRDRVARRVPVAAAVSQKQQLLRRIVKHF